MCVSQVIFSGMTLEPCVDQVVISQLALADSNVMMQLCRHYQEVKKLSAVHIVIGHVCYTLSSGAPHSEVANMQSYVCCK